MPKKAVLPGFGNRQGCLFLLSLNKPTFAPRKNYKNQSNKLQFSPETPIHEFSRHLFILFLYCGIFFQLFYSVSEWKLWKRNKEKSSNCSSLGEQTKNTTIAFSFLPLLLMIMNTEYNPIGGVFILCFLWGQIYKYSRPQKERMWHDISNLKEWHGLIRGQARDFTEQKLLSAAS